MPNWVWGVAFLVAYVVLTQWLLPKLGVPIVPTACRSGSLCASAAWRISSCSASSSWASLAGPKRDSQNHDNHFASGISPHPLVDP